MEFSCLRFAHPHLDRDTPCPETFGSLPLNLRERVFYSDDTPGDASLENGVHARRCSTVMAAWLQRYIECCPPCSIAGLLECHDLGMSAPNRLCPAASRDAISIDDNCTNRRVW
jgi:hypothetical protein